MGSLKHKPLIKGRPQIRALGLNYGYDYVLRQRGTGNRLLTFLLSPVAGELSILASRHSATQTLTGVIHGVFKQSTSAIRARRRGPARLKYRVRALILGAGLILTPVVNCQINLPDIGDSSQNALSNNAERILGDQIMREVRATMPILDDLQTSQYIQSLGYKLVSASDEQYLGFSFFIVQEQGVNAFALPGGYIGVNAGLILAAGSESELASVVAHEIAHVTQRHIARFVEANANSGLTTLAGILAAIAVGMVNPEAGKATAAVVIGGQAQNRLNFSRSNEQEADRIGMQLLDKAKFDPGAMARFFEKLQSSSRYYRKPPEFLSSHPVTSARIAETRDRALKLGYRQHPDSIGFKLAQARIRVLLAGTKKEALDFFKDSMSRASHADNTDLRYGLALALARNGQYQQALDGMQQLATQYPDNISISMSLAQIHTQALNPQAALAIYEERYHLYPDNHMVVVNFTRALLQSGNSARVLKILNDYKRILKLDAPLLRILAETLKAEGREAESQATLAEYFYQRGDLDGAIQQLTLASRQPGNTFYQASRIEARLETLKEEVTLRSKR